MIKTCQNCDNVRSITCYICVYRSKWTTGKERYGIVGSRSRTDEMEIRAFVQSLPNGSTVVSGGCLGVDTWAEDEARLAGFETRVFLPIKPANNSPNWAHAKAFHARNQLIAENCDILVAFVSENRKGGTEDTIKRATKLGKEIWIKGLWHCNEAFEDFGFDKTRHEYFMAVSGCDDG